MWLKSSLRALPLLAAVASLLVEAYIPRSFHVVLDELTWAEAQTYCRETYTDLASVLSHYDRDDLPWCQTNSGGCHIGLHRDLQPPYNWVWPWGEEDSYSAWASDYWKNKMDKDCCVAFDKKWYSVDDNDRRNFICEDVKLVVVRENKTWEEALDHCRALQADDSLDYNTQDALYDLPSLQSEKDLYYARIMLQKASTDQVWTGARFLGNEWRSVNGDDQNYLDLPSCPTDGRYCGALSKQGGAWNPSNCEERKNFLCYKRSL